MFTVERIVISVYSRTDRELAFIVELIGISVYSGTDRN